MLELYTAVNSICAQKVLITLAEKGLAYQTRSIDLFRNEQYSPAFLAINPKGVVPALDHDGAIVTESTLICEYLDDTFPSPRLIPEKPLLRARMRKWSKMVDEGLFEATREFSFSAMFRERMRGMSEEQRQTRFRNVGDPGRRARFMSTYEEGVESPFVLQGIAAFETAFKTMEADLAKAGPWLVGEAMTLADVNMMPFVARLDYLGLLDAWLAHRPSSQAWWARARAVPAFQAAIPRLLASHDVETMRASGARIRDRVAARRAELLAQQ